MYENISQSQKDSSATFRSHRWPQYGQRLRKPYKISAFLLTEIRVVHDRFRDYPRLQKSIIKSFVNCSLAWVQFCERGIMRKSAHNIFWWTASPVVLSNVRVMQEITRGLAARQLYPKEFVPLSSFFSVCVCVAKQRFGSNCFQTFEGLSRMNLYLRVTVQCVKEWHAHPYQLFRVC